MSLGGAGQDERVSPGEVCGYSDSRRAWLSARDESSFRRFRAGFRPAGFLAFAGFSPAGFCGFGFLRGLPFAVLPVSLAGGFRSALRGCPAASGSAPNTPFQRTRAAKRLGVFEFRGAGERVSPGNSSIGFAIMGFPVCGQSGVGRVLGFAFLA